MAELLSGRLDRISIASIIQLIEVEGCVGRLNLCKGSLTFSNGQLVGATFLTLQGLDAALEAMLRARGTFSLTSSQPVSGEAITDGMTLVMEYCRLQDELLRLGSARMEVRNDAPLRGVSEALIPHLRAGLTLAEALRRAGEPVVPVLDPIADAITAGAIRLAGTVSIDVMEALALGSEAEEQPAKTAEKPGIGTVPRRSPPKPPPELSFDDLVMEARRLVRRRDIDEAQRLLQEALAMRPDDRIVAQNLNRIQQLRARAIS